MDYTILGNTQMKVSTLCLGTMYFGTRTAEATAYQLLDQYIDAGGTFLDTANCYAFWADNGIGNESEEVIGRWMLARNNRDNIILATKVGCRPAFVGAEFPRLAQSLTADVIIHDVEQSLQRLRTDYIDLYYAHRDDQATPLEETLEAFARLIQAGTIRQIGCSNIAMWRIERAKQIARSHDWPEYCCTQLRHTLLRLNRGADTDIQVVVDNEHLDYCATQPDLTLLAYSALLSGAYTRTDRPIPSEYQSHDTEARLSVLRTVAQETGATPNQVVLAWMMQGEPAIIPIIAASTSEQLQENLDAQQVTLSPEQLHALTYTTGEFGSGK